jgi:hypothetical protein
MKTDLYTKTMLTIIAGTLLYLCLAKNPLPVRADSAQKAQEAPPQRVIIVGTDLKQPLLVAPTFINDQGQDMAVGKQTPLPVTNVP